MIMLSEICKSYSVGSESISVLKGISFQIQEHETVSIVGPSGSGKSTLLNILGGLDVPDNGSYYLEGQNVLMLSESRQAALRNQKIGFVFQSYHLIPHYSALENVMLPLVYAGAELPTRRELARSMLEKVGLDHRLHHFPTALSGGECQRVAIARALINDPPVILADEPTGNLDSRSGQEILKLLMGLDAFKKTVVIITHDNEVAKKAGRVMAMKDGQIT